MFMALNAETLGGAVADETPDTPVADTTPEVESEVPDHTEDAADETPDEVADTTADDDTAEPEAPALDDADVRLAKRMGLSDADLADFTDSKDLRRHLTMLDRAVLSRLRAPTDQRPDTAGQQRGEAEQDKSALKFEKYQLQLDPAKWDEETVGMLNGINDHYGTLVQTLAQRYEQAEQHLNSLLQQQEAQQWQRFDQEIDGYFGTLEETYVDTFGKGSVTSLDPHSPIVKNRQELVAEALALMEADRQMGRQPGSLTEALRRAQFSRFPDQTKTQARKEIETKVQQRRRQGVARPSNREKPRNALEKASANAIQKFKDFGFTMDDDDFTTPDSV